MDTTVVVTTTGEELAFSPDEMTLEAGLRVRIRSMRGVLVSTASAR